MEKLMAHVTSVTCGCIISAGLIKYYRYNTKRGYFCF